MCGRLMGVCGRLMGAAVAWRRRSQTVAKLREKVPPTTPITFEEVSKLGPMEQWEAVPEFGKVQIISAIFLIEHQSEWKLKPHYMAGGTPGDLKGLKSFWDPIGLTSKMDAEKLKCVPSRRRLSHHREPALRTRVVAAAAAAATASRLPLPSVARHER